MFYSLEDVSFVIISCSASQGLAQDVFLVNTLPEIQKFAERCSVSKLPKTLTAFQITREGLLIYECINDRTTTVPF